MSEDYFIARERGTERVFFMRVEGAKVIGFSQDGKQRADVDRTQARSHFRRTREPVDQGEARAAMETWMENNPWFTRKKP